MDDGRFVRITDGLYLDRSGRVVVTCGNFALVKLTTTNEHKLIARRWLRFETLTPVSVGEWRAREAGG